MSRNDSAPENRNGTLGERILAWLADGNEGTVAEIRAHFGVADMSVRYALRSLIAAGVLEPAGGGERPSGRGRPPERWAWNGADLPKPKARDPWATTPGDFRPLTAAPDVRAAIANQHPLATVWAQPRSTA